MSSPALRTTPDRRKHDRVKVDLRCQVNFIDRMAHGRLLDISYGGARIEMPMAHSIYEFDKLTSIHIRDVGLVRAVTKWKRDRLIGVEFTSPALVRQAVARLIATRDPRQVIRHIGS